jgi:hypothetical protein
MRVQFGSQSYQHSTLPLSAQRMVNCYLEPAPPAAKTLAAVVASYGIEDYLTVGTGPIRGAIAINGISYVVSGSFLYRMSGTNVTSLGAIPGIGRVSIAGTELTVMVVTNPDAYFYDGSSVQQITDPDFPGATFVANLDGYYVIIPPNSETFYLSGNRNPASWDGLDFASAEKYPDDLVQLIVNYGELIPLGRESGEVWANTGDTDFTLQRIPTGIFEKGCASRFGAAKVDNRVFFPGHDGIVYALNGYQPERVSTYPIEQAIAAAIDREFIGLSWQEAGHTFYGLSCDDFTLVYDVSTSLWHNRESVGQSHWNVTHVWLAPEGTLVGYGNKIGKLSSSTFGEWGEVLRSSCVSPPIGNEDNNVVYHGTLELVFEQGVGTITGSGSDPKVMLRHSDDGGRTWSSERWRSLGRVGERKSRARWSRGGAGRDRVYEYAITDPVRRTLIFATADYA